MLQADRHDRGGECTSEVWARHTVLLGQLICHTEDEGWKVEGETCRKGIGEMADGSCQGSIGLVERRRGRRPRPPM